MKFINSMIDSTCKRNQNNHYTNRRNLKVARLSKVLFCQLSLTIILLVLLCNTSSCVTAEVQKKPNVHRTSYKNSRSLHEILINENDGSIFSQTLSLHVAHSLNTIVQPHYKHRTLMISDYTNEGGTSNKIYNTTTAAQSASTTTSTLQQSLVDGQDIPEIEQEHMDHICQIIQKSFTGTSSSTSADTTTDNAVVCTCMGSIVGTLTINCDYSKSVCSYSNASTSISNTVASTTRSSSDTTGTTTTGSTSTGTIQTCGKPQLGVTMVRGIVFSATTCISSYERNLQSIPDTCVFVNSCSLNTEDDSNVFDSSNQLLYDDIESTNSIDQQQNTNTNNQKGVFCECTASYNGTICNTCEICADGQSMNIDCTTPLSPNGFKTSSTCQSIDLDLDLSNNAGTIAGFNPFFGTSMNTTTTTDATSTNSTTSDTNFCSQLELILNNNVTCDCTSLSTTATATNTNTSDYTISCTTIDEKCSPTTPKDSNVLCGTVTSFMHIRNGQIVTTTGSTDNTNDNTGTDVDSSSSTSTSTSTITSCVKYKEPFDETCTTFNYCSDANEEQVQQVQPDDGEQGQQQVQQSIEKLCSCTATYNGQNCSACNVCNDGLGVQLDCSNIYYEAQTIKNNECQLISRLDTNYEFVPAYTTTTTTTTSTSTHSSNNNKNNQQQQPSGSGTGTGTGTGTGSGSESQSVSGSGSGSVFVPVSIPTSIITTIIYCTILFGLILQ